jgi:hypothetical protein
MNLRRLLKRKHLAIADVIVHAILGIRLFGILHVVSR